MPYKFNPFSGNLDTVNESSGISTANADARYLMLDASNDPVTGALLLRNTSNSTAAFDVQTSGSAVVLRVDTTNSRVGVGTSSPDSPFHVVRVFSGNVSGQAIHVATTQSGNNTGFPRGLFIEVEATPSGSSNTLTAISGVARNTGAGTITNLRGYQMLLNPTSGVTTNGHAQYAQINIGAGAASIINASNFYADTPSNAGSMNVTYGFYAAPQVAGTQGSTPYSFYGAGTADRSYFAGSVGIGTSIPDAKLTVIQNVDDSAGGIRVYNSGTSRVGAVWVDVSNRLRLDSAAAGGGQISFNAAGTGNISIGTTTAPEKLTVNGNIGLLDQGDARFYDADSSNYTGFQAPTALAGDVIYTLPIADGTPGQVLSTNGTTALSWTTPSAGGSVTFNSYTSAGTSAWIKPTNISVVKVFMIGAGGGGGGGRSAGTASIRTGGAGGGGGAITERIFNASDIAGTVTVTVGTGGGGGAGALNANGSPGTAGTDSSFGTYAIAYGGGGGGEGTNSGTRAGGSGGGSGSSGNTGAAASTLGGLPASTAGADGISGQGAGATTGAAGSQAELGGASGAGSTSGGVQGVGGSSLRGGGGGGPGGSYTGGGVSRVPQVGGAANSYVGGGGGAAGTNGAAPTAGTAGADGNSTVAGSGGGGGGAGLGANGQPGGDGGAPGGGGGGGGACANATFTSGAGGTGGDGAVYVVCY